ncbi:hypothetical protein DSECCO2_627300 [anaerobic digester metagenome]
MKIAKFSKFVFFVCALPGLFYFGILLIWSLFDRWKGDEHLSFQQTLPEFLISTNVLILFAFAFYGIIQQKNSFFHVALRILLAAITVGAYVCAISMKYN